MKTLSLFEPRAPLPDLISEHEDFLLASKRYPIAAVADGPAGAVRHFCEEIIAEAEHAYDQFSEDILLRLFHGANVAALEMLGNRGNVEDHEPFAAAAFAAVVKDRLYWFSASHADVATIAGGGLRVLTDGSRRRMGDDVDAFAPVQAGVIHLRPETRVLVYSDGFAHHLNEPDFLNVIDQWPADAEEALRELDRELMRERPVIYGRERSLFAFRR